MPASNLHRLRYTENRICQALKTILLLVLQVSLNILRIKGTHDIMRGNYKTAIVRRFDWQLLAALIICNTVLPTDLLGQEPSEGELVNFAFGNYLGSGFYASNSGEVFILNIHMSTSLSMTADDEPEWVFNYPVTLGISNFDEISEGAIPDLNDVGTFGVIPGIEYRFPVLPNWQIIPFFDFRLARDMESNENIRVIGVGVKSFVDFKFGKNWLTLGNRLLYAEQLGLERDNETNFAVFETGLDYNIPSDITINASRINFSVYFINYYYLEDLVLLDVLEARVPLQNKNELGFTVSLPRHSWLPDNSRLGFGIQFSRNDDLYRLVIGAPFF